MIQDKKIHIRNSTAEFLVFTSQAGEQGIEVRVADETVWLTQKRIAVLFDVDVRTVSEHLQTIFATNELAQEATLRNFRTVQTEGAREVARNVGFYNLDAIIAVGFRVNSVRATQFRQWAIGVLRDFATRGYVLDQDRLKNGAIFDQAYFDNLISEIREIRASERRFYQKITDIYATAMDMHKKPVLLMHDPKTHTKNHAFLCMSGATCTEKRSFAAIPPHQGPHAVSQYQSAICATASHKFKSCNVEEHLLVHRNTAIRYLDALVGIDLLSKLKLGKENYYFNVQLYQLLDGAGERLMRGETP